MSALQATVLSRSILSFFFQKNTNIYDMYQISIIRFIIEYIFIVYPFEIMTFDTTIRI
jgi:hypothetical protein